MAGQPTANLTNNSVFVGAYLNGVIQGEFEIQNKQRAGGSSRVTFTGKPQDVLNQYFYLYDLGWEATIRNGTNTGVWTVDATLNRDVINNPVQGPPPQDQWELHGTSVQQHILECTDRPTIALLTTPAKEAIESQIKSPTNMATANYQGPNSGSVSTVYNLMRLGVEGRQQFFPTLKRTVTVAPDYSVSWVLTNVGKVLTSNTLVSTYSVPIAYSSIMPASTPPVSDTNGVTTFGGWLEGYPYVVKTGDNKIQVSQEWQFNPRWASVLYDQI